MLGGETLLPMMSLLEKWSTRSEETQGWGVYDLLKGGESPARKWGSARNWKNRSRIGRRLKKYRKNWKVEEFLLRVPILLAGVQTYLYFLLSG